MNDKEKKEIRLDSVRTAMIIIRCMMAAVLSSAVNHSFWWGLLHFFMGWWYMVYWMIVHSNALEVIKGAF